MPAAADLPYDAQREALRLLGERQPPSAAAAIARRLAETLSRPGTLRAVRDDAPPGAWPALERLLADGPLAVEALLGRGWWGRGTLPVPLDWLQRRALVAVDGAGRVHPTDEIRAGLAASGAAREPGPAAAATGLPRLRVEGVATVVTGEPAAIDRAVAVPAAGLRTVAPTVAVSRRTPGAVSEALRAGGVALDTDAVVTASPAAPALPGTTEEAVGPRAVRALLARAVDEARQVRLTYFASSRGGAATERVVDPWRFADDLLVGWCHLRVDERTFAVDRVGRAVLLPTPLGHLPPPGG